MTHIANSSIRPYRSLVRAQRADETRSRILDAAVRVLAAGFVSVSVPAVAREAGVSVPTVYRHFGTKRDLIAAIHPHLVRRAGLDRLVPPRSVDELRDGVRAYVDHLESLDDMARAAMASPASNDLRRLTMPDRLAAFRRFADSIEPSPSEADRERITRLLVVLTASSALRMWRDHLGQTVDEVVDDIDWVVRAAIAAATSGDGR